MEHRNEILNEIHVAKINGNEFVAGLMWQPLQRQRAHMAEAREIGKQLKMDIVSIREGETMVQAGFVQKGNGVHKGMYSLATALAGHIPHQSWIGAFELPGECYALVAVHNGLIVPGCDVVGGKDEIRNLLIEKDSQRKGLSFAQVYHPDDFEYRGQALDLEEALRPSNLRKEYKLKQLTFGMSKQELVVACCVAALVVAGSVGYWQWSAYQEKLARQEAARQELLRQQQLAELAAKSASSPEAQALDHPWASMPGITDFLNACQGAINSLPLSIGGWLFESSICTSTTLEAVYSRTGSTTFTDFQEEAATRFAAPAVLLEEGERAGLGDEISIGAGGDDELMSVDDMRAQFTSHLQRLDVKPVIVEVEPPAAPATEQLPGQPAPPAPPPPAWKKFTFTISQTQYPPETLFSEFSLPGVRLTETALTMQREDTQLNWNIKGEIYAR